MLIKKDLMLLKTDLVSFKTKENNQVTFLKVSLLDMQDAQIFDVNVFDVNLIELLQECEKQVTYPFVLKIKSNNSKVKLTLEEIQF